MKLSDFILIVSLICIFFCLFMIGREYGLDQRAVKDHNGIGVRSIQFYPRINRECLDPVIHIAQGLSMQPFVYDGDDLHLDKVNFSDVELGDVVVFAAGENSSSMHAVIAIYDEYLITAGYNNLRRDTSRVYPENLTFRYCEN